MPRFVILYHDCPATYERPSHWDLMFETEGVLRTWALRELPRGWQSIRDATVSEAADCQEVAEFDVVEAEPLGDHRLAYLDYVGPLSDARGQVCRIEAGDYTTVDESSERWTVSLISEKLSGVATLTAQSPDRATWQLGYIEK